MFVLIKPDCRIYRLKNSLLLIFCRISMSTSAEHDGEWHPGCLGPALPLYTLEEWYVERKRRPAALPVVVSDLHGGRKCVKKQHSLLHQSRRHHRIFFFKHPHWKKKKATIQKFWKLREKKNKNMDVKNTLGSAVTKADPQRQDWTYTFSAKCDTGAAGRHAEPRPRAAHHGAPRTRQSPSPFAQPSTEEGTCIRTKASNWCTRKFGKWTLK